MCAWSELVSQHMNASESIIHDEPRVVTGALKQRAADDATSYRLHIC